MQIRCDSCGRPVPVADTGVLPTDCPHCRGTPAPAQLGRWRIERLIAAGGMGEVYLGRHEELGSAVALKVLPQSPSGGAADSADSLRARFAREAKLTAAIDHPGVVRVLDYGEDAGRPFLVLELAAGRSLRRHLEAGPLPTARAVAIARAVAEVVGAAHERGVVHRDIKPENIVVAEPDDTVRVLDFGIARLLQDDQPLTRTGEVVGTPEYMAPEQLLEGAEAIDARTDVHALGLLLYEMLTGEVPLRGANLFATLKLVESLVPPPLDERLADLPAGVSELVARALDKDPEARPVDGREFAAVLQGPMTSAAASPRVESDTRARTAPLVAACLAFGVVVGTLLPGLFGGEQAGPADPGAQGATSASAGSERSAARERTPLESLRLALADDETGPFELQRLRADLASKTDVESLDVRAAAASRVGAFTAALRDRDLQLQSDPLGARDLAAVAWIELHVLLPRAVGAPLWLLGCDGARGARLLGSAESDERPASALLRACRALHAGECAVASAALAEAGDVPASLQLLVTEMACADREHLRRQAVALQPDEPRPAWRLLAAGIESAVALQTELRAWRDALDPTATDRWLADLLLAYVESREALLEPSRLYAAAEVAWLTGAGELAPTWCVALRVALQARDPRLALTTRELARCRRLIQGFERASQPTLAVLDSLLAAAEGGHVPLPVAPSRFAPLALFGGMPRTGTDTFTALLLGDARRAAALAAAAGGELPKLLVAWTRLDESERRTAWKQLLDSDADLELLRWLPADASRLPTLDDLGAALDRGVAPSRLEEPLRARLRATGVPLDDLLGAEAFAPHRDVLTLMLRGASGND